MAIPLNRLCAAILRIAVAAVFIYAGAVKIWNFKAGDWATQQFAGDLQNFQLTAYWTPIIVVAIYLPWVELAAGCALLLRRCELGALALLGVLAILFLGAMGSAWARGLDISCGCFGKENNATNFPLHISEDAALFVGIALLLWMRLPRGKSPDILTRSQS